MNDLTGHSGLIYASTLLPNGLIASGGEDFTIKIWNISITYPLYSLTGHTAAVRDLVVMNNQLLASCSYDHTIKIWSLSSYSVLKSWTAGTSFVFSLAFDSTINVLASGDNANLVKVWDSSIWTNITTNLGNIFENFFFNFKIEFFSIITQAHIRYKIKELVI